MVADQTDIDDGLKAILGLLPSENEGQQKRQHSLTRRDGEVMVHMIRHIMGQSQHVCMIGLSVKQMEAYRNIPAPHVEALDDMVKERKKLLNVMGVMTFGILAFIGKVLFEKIDWHAISKLLFGGK